MVHARRNGPREGKLGDGICKDRGEAMNTEVRPESHDALPEENEIVRQILKAIRSVRFGQVQIIIQDSRVVQIDKTEKVRLA